MFKGNFSFLFFFLFEQWIEVALYFNNIAAKIINQVWCYPTRLQLCHLKSDSCGVPKVGGQVSCDALVI